MTEDAAAQSGTNLYNEPRYYELAFGFRDTTRETDVMEQVIARHSGIEVHRVLEVACGPCPHLRQLLKRGYSFIGIDLNPVMLAYAREKVAGHEDRVELVEADITSFTLPKPADFAFVMLGSIYVMTWQQYVSHFDCIARVLRPGGLYFLDWCVDFDPYTDIWDTWRVEKEDAAVNVTYVTKKVDRVEQTVQEEIIVQAEEAGQRRVIQHRAVKRVVFPQEFLRFVESRPDFEFVGWWNEWDLDQPLDGFQPTNRPIIVLRRTSNSP